MVGWIVGTQFLQGMDAPEVNGGSFLVVVEQWLFTDWWYYWYFVILPAAVVGPLCTGLLLALDAVVAVLVGCHGRLAVWSVSVSGASLVVVMIAFLDLLSWSPLLLSSSLLNMSPDSAVWWNLVPRWDPAELACGELIIHLRKKR